MLAAQCGIAYYCLGVSTSIYHQFAAENGGQTNMNGCMPKPLSRFVIFFFFLHSFKVMDMNTKGFSGSSDIRCERTLNE